MIINYGVNCKDHNNGNTLSGRRGVYCEWKMNFKFVCFFYIWFLGDRTYLQDGAASGQSGMWAIAGFPWDQHLVVVSSIWHQLLMAAVLTAEPFIPQVVAVPRGTSRSDTVLFLLPSFSLCPRRLLSCIDLINHLTWLRKKDQDTRNAQRTKLLHLLSPVNFSPCWDTVPG